MRTRKMSREFTKRHFKSEQAFIVINAKVVKRKAAAVTHFNF